MKRILGLDLGSTSIGWALIEEYSSEITSSEQTSAPDKIVAIGSRIIPLTTDESSQFSKGQALTKNADRTKARTQRKGYDRYQLRRSLLLHKLSELGMYSGSTLHLSKMELWALRASAPSQRISLLDLGRVLSHINQKRGYRTSKSDFGDKKTGAYVQQVVSRYRTLHELNLTIGQYMYQQLQADESFRCKELIYPRDAYIEEFDAIMAQQQTHYPDILTPEVILHLRNYIIFHQRPLKSCKHLVSKCPLESREHTINGRNVLCGPTVAPRSSPLFQVCKIWESINNIRVVNKHNQLLEITPEQKLSIFEFMYTHDKLKVKDIREKLNITSHDWQFSEALGGNGLQGNTTYCAIAKALGKFKGKDALLRFELKIADGKPNTETGEISKVIDSSFEEEPLYSLWHTLYSTSDIDILNDTLLHKFNIDDASVREELCKLDFVKAGYSNKSSRAIRKILPHLQEGKNLYEATLCAGYSATTLTREENLARTLLSHLQPIPKGALRQPVVEKILNQLVNLVNALIDQYGRFDEIRIELARELKQNREERESATKAINKSQRDNEIIASRILSEYGLTPTRTRIQKYKMWEESHHTCVYCGQNVGAAEFLRGFDVEVEHIIPRSVIFDDSFSNKVCSCHKCNSEKGNLTAFDYMSHKSNELFTA